MVHVCKESPPVPAKDSLKLTARLKRHCRRPHRANAPCRPSFLRFSRERFSISESVEDGKTKLGLWRRSCCYSCRAILAPFPGPAQAVFWLERSCTSNAGILIQIPTSLGTLSQSASLRWCEGTHLLLSAPWMEKGRVPGWRFSSKTIHPSYRREALVGVIPRLPLPPFAGQGPIPPTIGTWSWRAWKVDAAAERSSAPCSRCFGVPLFLFCLPSFQVGEMARISRRSGARIRLAAGFISHFLPWHATSVHQGFFFQKKRSHLAAIMPATASRVVVHNTPGCGVLVLLRLGEMAHAQNTGMQPYSRIQKAFCW